METERTLFQIVTGLNKSLKEPKDIESLNKLFPVFRLLGENPLEIANALREFKKTNPSAANKLEIILPKLGDLATSHPKSGLYNSSMFEHDLTRMGLEAKRNLSIPGNQFKGLGCLAYDIDNFKQVNDFGHLVGDEGIKAIADISLDTLRESDGAYGLGGDEFAALLPGISKEGLEVVAKKLVTEINTRAAIVKRPNSTVSVVDLKFDTEILEIIRPLSVSMGLSHYDTDTSNFKDLYKLADEASNEAKKFKTPENKTTHAVFARKDGTYMPIKLAA